MMLRTIISMMGGVPITNPYTLAFVSTVASRGGNVTANEITYLSTFEASMGSDLLEFDRLWIHGLGDSVAARTSFVNPSTTAITPVNNPTFNPSEGYQSNGTTSYLDHNVAESALVKYTQNSNSIFLYSLSNISEIANEYGVFNGASIITSCIINSSTISYLGNNTSIGSINFTSNTNSIGLFGCLRVNNSMTNYKNSVSYNSYTSSPQALSNLNFYSLCRNENGSPVIFSTKKHALIGYGSSNINQSNFYNAVQTLGTSLGWFSYTTTFKSVVISRGGSLTSTEEAYLRTFEASVGSDLGKMDRLWIHGLSNDIAARTSFVNPSSTMITPVNSPTFTANRGFTGNGSTSYLDTNFNPATHGVNYTLNTASIFQYERATINGLYCGIGEQQSYLFPTYLGNSYFTINNGSSNNNFSVLTSAGFLFADRSTSTLTNCYKDGTFKSSLTNSATNYATNNFYLLALLQGGTPLYPSPGNIALSGIGGTGINQLNFYNAVQALGTSIGWAV